MIITAPSVQVIIWLFIINIKLKYNCVILGLSRLVGKGEQFPPEKLDAMFPGASSDIKSNNFVALRYLLEKHKNTSFEDLKVGFENLNRDMEAKKVAPAIFIKENLSAYLLGEQSLQVCYYYHIW